MTTAEKRLTISKARNLLREYGDFLNQIKDECEREIIFPISGTTTDEIALQYKRQEGAREGLALFMKKINAKANGPD